MLLCAPGAARAQTEGDEDLLREARAFSEFSSSAVAMRDSIVALARAQIGTPYKLGGTTPGRGFDCSGLVRYVLGALRVALPRTAAQQATVGADLPKDTTRLRPGDLLTFGKGNRITHVGIYVGSGRYVHASTTAGRVIETSLSRTRSPLVRSWRGGRRVLADADPVDTAAAPAR
jgi:cell wall-associated NlpC family hydrolase